MLFGEKLHVGPNDFTGLIEQVRATVELNPLAGATVMVVLICCPAEIVAEAGGVMET
jgi:hypothetical protein